MWLFRPYSTVVSSLIIFNNIGEYWIVYDSCIIVIIIITVLCVFSEVLHTFEIHSVSARTALGQ